MIATMNISIVRNPARSEWPIICLRSALPVNTLENLVSGIIEDVKSDGDKAVRNYAMQFDGIKLEKFRVTDREIQDAVGFIGDRLKNAIGVARKNISVFHASQKQETTKIETSPG